MGADRAEQLHALKQMTLDHFDSAIGAAIALDLEDDDWVSRLKRCRASVAAEIGADGSRRRSDPPAQRRLQAVR